MQKFQKGVDLDTVLAGDMDGIELLQCDVIHGIVIRLTSDFIHGVFCTVGKCIFYS